jgi:hypothetical protein
MRIAFFVNDVATEFPGYTTTVLAHQAAMRGHDVMYITPSDFIMERDDTLRAHVRRMPQKKWASREGFFEALKTSKTTPEAVDLADVDVLWLRSDPSLDATTEPWRAEAGILFGREATKRGILVLTHCVCPWRAINSLDFAALSSLARAETIITRDERDIKAFAKAHKNNIILKPLQGSGGLAKDAIYLEGFRAVIDHVAGGGSLMPFWLGKIAGSDVPAMEELLQRGLVHAPLFMPEYLSRPNVQHRIQRLKTGIGLDQLL